MTCPDCQRDNHPRRRYCGRCGCNFAPTCTACGFANDHDDRFCGGCGDLLGAGSAGEPQAASDLPVDELAGLFVVPIPASQPSPLPDSGIGQDHLDQLFGAIP